MYLSHCVFHTGAISPCIADPTAARDALDELFTHSDVVSPAFYLELQAVGIRLPQPPIRIVTIVPGPGHEDFSMGLAARFAEDMASQLPSLLPMDGIFCYINSRMQGIVSVPDKGATQQLYTAMLALVERYPRNSRPHVAISNSYDSHLDISRACVENQEAHMFERFLTKPIDVIVQPQDFFLYGSELPPEDDDAFFGQISQKICNAMTIGDQNMMHRALDEALNYMVSKFPRVSGIHMRAIHFCKPLEMNLVGADLIDRLFVQKFRLVQRVIESDSEQELRDSFHRQMDLIWDYSMERKQLHHGELMHRVAEYIERNLSDSMLSIPTIAEAFHMPEARLSSAFRQYYQESIPNFIHQRRIATIKKQLVSTQKPIRELALEAGYISIATMNRAFLKQEGIYPGQYRQKHKVLSETSESK